MKILCFFGWTNSWRNRNHYILYDFHLYLHTDLYACSWSGSDILYIFLNEIYDNIWKMKCMHTQHAFLLHVYVRPWSNEETATFQMHFVLLYLPSMPDTDINLIYYCTMCTPHSLRAVTLLNLSFTIPTWHMTLTHCLCTKQCLYIFHIPFFHPFLFHFSAPSNPSFAELWLIHLLLYFFFPSHHALMTVFSHSTRLTWLQSNIL